VEEWEPRPVDEILAGQQTLWDSPNVEERSRLDIDNLEAYPIVDENGNEIPIYTERGTRIARRVAYFDRDLPSYAGLVKLANIHELFYIPPQDEVDLDDEENPQEIPSPTNYSVYPQAGLRKYGHFQADGIMTDVKPFITSLNDTIRHRPTSTLSGSDEGEACSLQQPVTGIATQAYNSMMHFARGKGAQHHDAQLGLITSALAGSYALSHTAIRIARTQSTKCEYDLPHQRFASKIAELHVDRELRFENVYCIDLHAVRPDLRTGRQVSFRHHLI
jgi:hypothetical protein